MVEIYIEDLKLDLEEQNIVHTFQLNDIGKLDKVQTSYTNSFKIPRTPKNEQIFNFIGLTSRINTYSASRFPYGIQKVSLHNNGFEIVREGFAYLFDITDEHYSISVYGAEKSFFDTLKTKTLKDVFSSGVTVGYNTNAMSHYILRDPDSSGEDLDIAFAYAKYNSLTEYFYQPHEMHIEVMAATPQFFVYRFFNSIFEELGYEVEHDLLLIDEFKKLVINGVETAESLGLVWGDSEPATSFLPEIGADVFLKEILIRYGLIVKVVERDKKIYLKNIDELITDDPEDWSSKFESIKKQTFRNTEYAINNFYEYQEDEFYIPEGGYYSGDPQYETGVTQENELRGEFEIENDTIPINKTQITSNYKKPIVYETDRTLFDSVGLPYLNAIDLRASYGIEPLIGQNQVEVESYLMHLDIYKDSEMDLQYYLRYKIGRYVHGVGVLSIIDDDYNFVSVLTYPETKFQNYLDAYYPKFISMLNEYHKFNVLIRLNTLDIYNLDLFKPIYIKQLGANFYINRVINYKEGKLTEVEIIKIPVNI